MNESAPQGDFGIDNLPISDADQSALYEFTRSTPHHKAVRALYVLAWERVNANHAAPVAAPSVADPLTPKQRQLYDQFRASGYTPDESLTKAMVNAPTPLLGEGGPQPSDERIDLDWLLGSADMVLARCLKHVGGSLERDVNLMRNSLRVAQAALLLPAVVQAGSHLDHQAAPHSTQPAAHQLDTQRATEGMPAPVRLLTGLELADAAEQVEVAPSHTFEARLMIAAVRKFCEVNHLQTGAAHE